MRTETLKPPWKIKRIRFSFTYMVKFSGIEGTIRDTENGRRKHILNLFLCSKHWELKCNSVTPPNTGDKPRPFMFSEEVNPGAECLEEFKSNNNYYVLTCHHVWLLWSGPDTSSFPWGGAWFCLGSKIRWWVVIVGRTQGEVDGHMDTSVNVLGQFRLQGWMVTLVWKVVPLLSWCGEKVLSVYG